MAFAERFPVRDQNPDDYHGFPLGMFPPEGAPSRLVVPFSTIPLLHFQLDTVFTNDTVWPLGRLGLYQPDEPQARGVLAKRCPATYNGRRTI